MKSIPTNYHYTNFRSRLEARWASFFDHIGWKWEYEPIDYHGWAPDFLIHGKNGPILVEVKPSYWLFGKYDPYLSLELFEKATNNKETEQINILLLGVCPLIYKDSVYQESLAFIGMCNQGCDFDRAVVQESSDPSIIFGYCHKNGDYSDRVTGFHKSIYGIPDSTIVDRFWKEAGNKTQWMSV